MHYSSSAIFSWYDSVINIKLQINITRWIWDLLTINPQGSVYIGPLNMGATISWAHDPMQMHSGRLGDEIILKSNAFQVSCVSHALLSSKVGSIVYNALFHLY